jgi:riboflavin kinase / FMN adenylyltransferase
MQVHQNILNLPVFKNAVVTIGTFDGVHTGHQQIIAQLKQEAAAINGETVIITFHPHPRKIVSEKKFFILNTLEEKIHLLEVKGIDHLVVVPFDENFAHQTAEEYVTNFLFEKFHPYAVIIGYDHRFGKDRNGDYHLLEDYGKKLGFAVKEIPEHLLHKVIVSSTRIREALLAGDVATANEYLGYEYFFEGIVVEGDKLGRRLGYPTANLTIEDPEKLIPGNGIYVVVVQFPVSDFQSLSNMSNRQPATGNEHKGMMSIGVRPTVITDAAKRVIEINIFDFDKDIYGQKLRVYVKHYMRPEVKFRGLEELKSQLTKDKQEALSVLNIKIR